MCRSRSLWHSSTFRCPISDGFGLAQEIQRRPALNTSMITMLLFVRQRGDGARARELGVASYLTKPVRQSVLLDAMHAVRAGE